MQTPLQNALQQLRLDGMISYIEAHPEDFEELLQIAIGSEDYAWNAAWLIHKTMNGNDPRLAGEHIDGIIEAATSKKRDGHQRELLKILFKIDLSETQEAVLFDACAGIWEQIHKQPGLRYTAFKMMMTIARKYPDLLCEIRFFAQPHYLETLSPGILHGLKKMLKF
ncbi:MAG: hypothetical protein LBS07_01935 [Prevotellaceae bacterium]|jgi:hypothetical protein|nr:hypothetical protein [Prevotellaceae bacterium]